MSRRDGARALMPRLNLIHSPARIWDAVAKCTVFLTSLQHSVWCSLE
jgi:hypothetical protein